MANLDDVWSLANRLGIRLTRRGKKVIAVPGSAVTKELAEAIRANKKTLLAELVMIEQMARPHLSWEGPTAQEWWATRNGG